MDNNVAADVEAYLAGIEEPFRGMLERIRAIVRSAAPDAVEAMAYGIPTFRLDGNLVHYAAFKKHCSFFPGAIVLDESLKEDLAGFKIAKGTIQFTPDNPLPDELVRKIVALRVIENRNAVAARKSKKAARSTNVTGS
ncbi:DUF1801 domain-containing protein [Rhizobium sp. KVB221]|uniref:DUF1801 domain-containing protein n=1 Tax=Rhizobium setariae TaxID=2801340 RepID=A0A936YTK5_9HYPH|nr:DUF1801 domain-containing protein [Rhizobium setariae]MBL0374666.1 DUF1801 domain-containing protein [Rhizobium setariae]